MKTIEDALDKYDCKWPEGATHIAWCGSDDALFPCVGPVIDGRRWKNICTRKEFEEAVEERKTDEWMPEVATVFEADVSARGFEWAFYVGHNSDGWHVIEFRDNNDGDECRLVELRTFPKCRQIKTEREKFVACAWENLGKMTCNVTSDVLGRLFDAGCRFAVGE